MKRIVDNILIFFFLLIWWFLHSGLAVSIENLYSAGNRIAVAKDLINYFSPSVISTFVFVFIIFLLSFGRVVL